MPAVSGTRTMMHCYSRRFRQAVDLAAVCLGLLGLIAQAIAPVCLTGGFAPSSGNSVIICTAHGYRTVALDTSGHPAPAKPDHGGDTQCPMCAAAHITPVLVPLAALLLVILIFSRADRFSVALPAIRRRAYSHFITRGPPAAVAAFQ